MSQENKRKQKMLKQKEQDIFDSKIFFKKYLKRYLIVLAFAAVPVIIANILLAVYAKGLYNWIVIIIDIVILLFACFIGLVIFNKIEEKRMLNPKAKEKERDPFSD